MIRLLILTVLLGLLYFGAQRAWRAWSPTLKKRWRDPRSLLMAGIAVVLLLAATGRLAVVLAGLGALGAFALRNSQQLLRWAPMLVRVWRELVLRARTFGGAGEAATAWLRLARDPATGALDGMVLAGRFAGKALSSLSVDQLLSLLYELRGADAESSVLLETYLDMTYGSAWRRVSTSGDGGGSGSHSGKMSREEAGKILGVSPDASQKDIVTAHRRLMQKFHPDRGGSDYLAAKINLAKEVLLKR